MCKWKLTAATLFFSLFTLNTFATPLRPCSLYFLGGLGESYSRKADITANPIIWDPSIDGYNAKLGRSVLYTVGVGYQILSALGADIQLTYRPGFSYSKFQRPTPDSSTPGFLGTKTRRFDLDNTSLMFNLTLNGAAFDIATSFYNDCITIFPFIGAGLGVSYNTLWNFHSVLPFQTVPGLPDVSSIENYERKASFSWQVMLGISFYYMNNWSVDIGYRYFDAGSFKSSNYLTNIPGGLNALVSAYPWHGKLRANEGFVNLTYHV